MNRYLLAVVVMLAGCTSHAVSPTAPSSSANVLPQSPPPAGPRQCSSPSAKFPSPTRAARVYLGATTCPSASRFVLYDDGSFVLQYFTLADEYRGTYGERDGTITFQWDGWSVAGPWAADGTITPETLSVHFNQWMLLDDFEDAVYTRVP